MFCFGIWLPRELLTVRHDIKLATGSIKFYEIKQRDLLFSGKKIYENQQITSLTTAYKLTTKRVLYWFHQTAGIICTIRLKVVQVFDLEVSMIHQIDNGGFKAVCKALV